VSFLKKIRLFRFVDSIHALPGCFLGVGNVHGATGIRRACISGIRADGAQLFVIWGPGVSMYDPNSGSALSHCTCGIVLQ
jgi:hypothetical protein